MNRQSDREHVVTLGRRPCLHSEKQACPATLVHLTEAYPMLKIAQPIKKFKNLAGPANQKIHNPANQRAGINSSYISVPFTLY